MASRNPSFKKAKVLKRSKGSNSNFSVYTIDSNPATIEDSSGPSTSAKNAPLISADVHSSSGHVPTANACVHSAYRPKLSGKKEDFIFWQIRAEAYFDNLDLLSVLNSTTPDPIKNKKLYLELVNLMDNESLQVISSTAQNDGK